MKDKAIFLDRDGTINFDLGYVHKIEDLKFLSGVIQGLKNLQQAGYKLIIVTNQSGIARGYYTEQDYHIFQRELRQRLNKNQIFITGEYFCPHHPEKGKGKYKADCKCRKPGIGMLEQAARDFNLDLNKCWMIGDKTDDIEMGKRAGCRTILVETGETGKDRHFDIKPDYIAKTMVEAVGYIIEQDANK